MCSPEMMWLTILALEGMIESFERSGEDSELEKILRQSCKHQKHQVKVEVEHLITTSTIEWSIVDIVNNVVPLESDGSHYGEGDQSNENLSEEVTGEELEHPECHANRKIELNVVQEPVLVNSDPVVGVKNVKAKGSEQSQDEAGKSIEGKGLPIVEITEELVGPFFN